MTTSQDDQPNRSPAVRKRSPAVAFVLLTVALDVLAMGLMIPVLPKLVESMAGSTQAAAIAYGVFGTAWAVMQFFFSPVLGALSDRFGRRPVLLLSSLGLGLDYILMALAPNLAWLFIGRVISGITAATFSTATAYIADVTPPEERAAKFGLIGAAFGVGFVLGPAVGGLLGSTDPRLPFWIAAAFSLTNTAYGYFILPESLPPEKRSAFTWRRASPLGSLELLRSHATLSRLAVAIFLYNVAHGVFPAVFVLHAGYRFGWETGMVGVALAVFGIGSGFVQGLLVRPAIARLGEWRTLVLGMGFGIAGLLCAGIAPTAFWFWAGYPFMMLWGLIGPSAQAITTRLVGAGEQGRLQGAFSGLMSIASLIAPSLFTSAFALGIDPRWDALMPGAPYVVGALLLVAATAVVLRAKPRQGRAETL